MDDAILYATAHDLLARFRARTLSPVEAVDAALARLDRVEPTLNAFQLVDADAARAAARASEARWAKGTPAGPLDGVATTIKDTVLTAGWPTLKGSATVDPDQPWDEDAPVVARLREAGAVLLGKTTTPEFGWKGITDGPLFGTTRSPWDPARSPGGSSGGAAAALAAGVGALAHGNDGGGSIRIPASYSGLFGLKPSFGRVPQYPGADPFSTTVANGPIARSVADAALMLNVVAQPDPRDWYAAEYTGRDWLAGLDDGVDGLRIAYAPGLGGAEPAADVAACVGEAVAAFAERGARFEEAGPVIEPLKPRFETYWIAGFAHIMRGIAPEKRPLMDPGLRALAEAGESATLDDYCRAMTARAELGARMNAFHGEFDLLVTPTTPTTAPPADTVYHSGAFDRWTCAVPYTLPFNLTGQPAASIPCGVTSAGLPVGLQIVGPRFGEAVVLRAARAFERARPFPHPHPRLAASLGAIAG